MTEMTKQGAEVFPLLIVGAGLSGLVAARRLVDHYGAPVELVDKGRGVGGRLATRRMDGDRFDHGAQYFTARDPVFQNMVQGWVNQGLARVWSTGFALEHGGRKEDGFPRYIMDQGMTQAPKALASGLPIHLGRRVISVGIGSLGWEVKFDDEEETTWIAKRLLLTAPVPQCLEWLEASSTRFDPKTYQRLCSIEYQASFATMVRLKGPSHTPAPGGVWLSGEPLSWIADNTQKGIGSSRPDAPDVGRLTIHAGPEFTKKYWDTDRDEVGQMMIGAAKPWLGSAVDTFQTHRWKYSLAIRHDPAPYLEMDSPHPLWFAGDGFCAPRIEGAALSGWHVAEAIAREMET
jgi:renalase